MISIFSYGAFDRYDFKLVGKKEMIVPYNMNKLRLLTKEQQMELQSRQS